MPSSILARQMAGCDKVDCKPSTSGAIAPAIPKKVQSLDYMAKDFDSFLRAMLDQLPSRLPGWVDRSEADLGMALLECFAYVGDQLSYYQDRVANEAFLNSAVQYDSVRRLLGLIDYRLDPGRAANVLVSVNTTGTKVVPVGFQFRTKATGGIDSVIFESSQNAVLQPQLNQLSLAQNAVAGDTTLVLSGTLDDLLAPASWLYFSASGPGEWCQVIAPITVTAGQTKVALANQLRNAYASGTQIIGNGILATHGQSRIQNSIGTGLPNQTVDLEYAPLTYTSDATGDPVSSLRVVVNGLEWNQIEDFIDSVPADPQYRLTQDNAGFVTIHFGTGETGANPDPGAPIQISFRNGIGEAGFIAAGALTDFDDPDRLITTIHNPLASYGGADPQNLDNARLLGPRAIYQQNRAVTPNDYQNILLQGVQFGTGVVSPLRANARFAWTGSWTTVFVSVEMPDRLPLTSKPGLQSAFESALASKKMTGYDVQVEDAHYVALYIALVAHLKPQYFARQIRQSLSDVLGPSGFFAAANFTFGQAVHLSDLYTAALGVEGIQYLSVTRFKRLGDRYPDSAQQGSITIAPLEIVRCDNDPSHPENGILSIRTCGGKEG
jgi:hypothetical protein